MDKRRPAVWFEWSLIGGYPTGVEGVLVLLALLGTVLGAAFLPDLLRRMQIGPAYGDLCLAAAVVIVIGLLVLVLIHSAGRGWREADEADAVRERFRDDD